MAPPAKIDSPLLVNVFGTDVKEIGETVRDFDFKKIVVGENASDAYLHTELAPSFGGALEKESLKDLDNKLKIVIAATLKQLGMMTDKSWTETMSNLMQNSFLVPEDSVVDQADSLVKETKTSFLLEGSQADVATVKEVKEWFDKLLKDEDVIESTQLDFDVLSKVVSQAGTVIQDWFAIQEKQHYEQPLIDIGVLRFPDAKRPYFKLYHIKLTAWVDSARILTQKNGEERVYWKVRQQILPSSRKHH